MSLIGLYSPTTGKLVRAVESISTLSASDTAGLVQDVIPNGFDELTMVRTGSAAFATDPALVIAQQQRAMNNANTQMVTVEINLGYPARRAGKFTIAGLDMVTGKAVAIWLAPGPYTGKGMASSFDEVQLYSMDISGRVTSATLITAWWSSRHRIGGNVKFNLQIGA